MFHKHQGNFLSVKICSGKTHTNHLKSTLPFPSQLRDFLSGYDISWWLIMFSSQDVKTLE